MLSIIMYENGANWIAGDISLVSVQLKIKPLESSNLRLTPSLVQLSVYVATKRYGPALLKVAAGDSKYLIDNLNDYEPNKYESTTSCNAVSLLTIRSKIKNFPLDY